MELLYSGVVDSQQTLKQESRALWVYLIWLFCPDGRLSLPVELTYSRAFN